MTSDTLDSVGFNDNIYAPRFAGFGVRLGAYIIDMLVLIPFIGASVYFSSFNPNALAYLGIALLTSLYKPIMEMQYGATVGKMATKIKVVGAEGVPITPEQAFMRWIPFFVGTIFSVWLQYSLISGAEAEGITGYMEFAMYQQEYMAEMGVMAYLGQLLGFLPLVSALFMLGNQRKQAAHDTLAKTYVIYKEQAATPL
ncbi:RDD family protein [Neolewinella lacunae]|uniref:RDD family protein n=1 Tax=Neolewinella lacunae TaxID=1517758 RepID=A0A923PSK7_9BACT|nr:RDD family protein [Neolewinella lacunae]MBC6996723.1 RDD family protein [Neolewinella lacunae]MDN3633412.1 RDD family protein [Neolewinella lacunae]